MQPKLRPTFSLVRVVNAGPAGCFNIAIQYFDLQCGAAKFSFDVNGRAVGSGTANATFPSRVPNGDNSTRITERGVH